VGSGLDALLLSLRAAGIGPGDEVITAPNSFIASVAAIALVGARPVFADADWDYNINPVEVAKGINSRTRAILPVHLTGNPCAMDMLTRLAQAHNLILIEDAAQAIGAVYDGRPVGSLGDFGCFSLHPLKNLHVWGDGGFISVKDEAKAAKLRRQRNHGLVHRDEAEYFSYNSRLDTVQAAVALVALPLLEETTHKRIANAKRYRAELGDLSEVTLPPVNDAKAMASYHVFQIRVRGRDALRAFLAERGIETKIHYPVPIHLQKAASYLEYKRGDFPVSEQLAEEILSIPIRESLTELEIERICDTLRAFYR
jgi:dTDP-4-amino-4,6-dideoxygalactose transaminase